MRQFNKGLRFRYIEEDDAEQVAKWFSDPAARGSSKALAVVKLQDARHWVQVARSKTRKLVHVVLQPEGTAIGIASFYDVDMSAKSVNAGLAIFDKSSRGKGYGYSAKLLQLYLAFEEMRFNRVIERISSQEEGLIRYMEENLSYRRCGVINGMDEIEITTQGWAKCMAQRRA